MAKISARGASKVAQASKEWTDEDGYDHRVILALRSDGKLLRKHNLRSPMMREACGSRGWNTGTYSIVGAVKLDRMLARFEHYCTHHRYTIK